MKSILLSFLTLLSLSVLSQNWEHYQTSDSEGYLALPQVNPIGLIVRDYSTIIDTTQKSRFQFGPLSLEAGFAVLYTRTSQYYPDLYLDDSGPARLDSLVHQALRAHPEINRDNLFIGGISASGARSLKYVEYCGRGLSSFGHTVRGVFAVDPPLDLVRFYRSSQKIIERNHPSGNLEESHLIINTLDRELGKLETNFQSYIQSSVYCYLASDSLQITPYLQTAIRLYHEPDVQWWIDHRMESTYESNMPDVTGFFVALKGLQHPNAEIIHTENKGFDSEGNPKPHSWTIVDEQELVDWLMGLCSTP